MKGSTANIQGAIMMTGMTDIGNQLVETDIVESRVRITTTTTMAEDLPRNPGGRSSSQFSKISVFSFEFNLILLFT